MAKDNSILALPPPSGASGDAWSDDDLFGPPPIMPGEDREAYKALLDQFYAAVQPKNILERMWLRDAVNLIWESKQYRRFKGDLMRVDAHKGVREILRSLGALDQSFAGIEDDGLVKDWAGCRPSAVKKVTRILEAAGLGQNAIVAKTFDVNLELFEHIDRLIANNEMRKSGALHEIQAVIKAANATEEVEDAEFPKLETPQAPRGVQ